MFRVFGKVLKLVDRSWKVRSILHSSLQSGDDPPLTVNFGSFCLRCTPSECSSASDSTRPRVSLSWPCRLSHRKGRAARSSFFLSSLLLE